jgi:hypothetical protein
MKKLGQIFGVKRFVKQKMLVVFFLAAAGLTAQTVRGVISGIVTDDSKKPLAGAAVTLVRTETNTSRTTLTNAGGEFHVALLPPGVYRLETARDGFRTHTQAITLEVNQDVRVEIALAAGQRTDRVEVTATAPMLRTETSSIGGVIDARQVQGLPLDRRNFYELSLLLPGVFPAAQGSAGSVRGDFAISVNGAREDSNNFLLDGAYNGDPKLNGVAMAPSVDAIREFEVLTSTYDATFGRNAGGQISVVTRSGTNQLHGTLFEFFRNRALNTRNYFAPPGSDQQYQRNQFGGSLGGPIVRNKTFFFADYEGLRLRDGQTRFANVPTLLERTGDFSQSRLIAIDPTNGQPIPGNRLPPFFQHPVGQAVAALYPAPNRTGPEGNFISSRAIRDTDNRFDARVDHILGRSDDLAARYSFNDRTFFDPFAGSGFSPLPGYGLEIPRRAQNAVLTETHIFSPVLLNELRMAFNRVSNSTLQENAGTSINRRVGLPELSSNSRDWGLSQINITGFSVLGHEYTSPQHGATNTYQIGDAATYSRGRHLLRFGFDHRVLQQNAFRDVQARGFLNFTGQLLGNPLQELLLGLPTITGGARLDNPQHLRVRSTNFFAQDTWRLRPDLVLTLGLRYEYNTPAVDAADRANLYDPAQGKLVPVGKNGFPRAGYEPDRNNLAPQIGLAWSRGGWVVRSAYGIHYDQSSLAPGEGLYFSPPYFDLRIFFQFQGLPPLMLSDPFPAFFPIPVPGSASAYQRDLATPYLQHWNFGVQRELGKSRVVELAYVGSKGTHLIAGRDINQPRPSNTPRYVRSNPAFEDINIVESRANSSYHSFQARVQQRLSGGLSLLGSYTWSKSIDDASNFFSAAGDSNFPQDSYNARAERARSNFDAAHRLAISYGYDLPFGKGHRWLGGWQSYGVLTFQSGRPFTVAILPQIDNSNTGLSNLGFGGGNDRPNVLRDPELSSPAPARWFDTAAFVMPPRGTFGNAGRNILEGPGFANVNFSVVKNTALAERVNLQIRSEFFNLFDRANFDLPDNFLGSPTFGQVLSAQAARRIQFGVKLIF